MAETFYDIDPSGDTLLILHNANAPFAVLPPPTLQEEQKSSDSSPDDKPASQPQNADGEPKDGDSKPKDADSKPTVRMRLSSKHLISASTYFKKMAANEWKETACTPEAGYSFTVNAHDWDEEALVILMNIIHGRTRKVPRKVDLEMLAKIAVLVDYYQCHEAVEFFAQTWLGEVMMTDIPLGGERRDFMLRIVVCLVFSRSMELRVLGDLVVRFSKEPVDSLDLPIRQDLIDTLNKTREDVIFGVVSGLHALKAQLCEGQACTFDCSSIYLGALIKNMSKMNVFDPRPERPFPGLSLHKLEEGIRDMKEPTLKPICSRVAAITLPESVTTQGIINDSSGDETPDDRSPSPVFTFGFGTGDQTLGNRTPPPAHKFGNRTVLKPVGKLNKTPVTCSLATKTKPIIEELLAKLKGLDLRGFNTVHHVDSPNS